MQDTVFKCLFLWLLLIFLFSAHSNSSERNPGRFWFQCFSLQQNLSSFGKQLCVWTRRPCQAEPKPLTQQSPAGNIQPTEAEQPGSGFSVGLGYPCFKIPVWLGATHSISLVPYLSTESQRPWSLLLHQADVTVYWRLGTTHTRVTGAVTVLRRDRCSKPLEEGKNLGRLKSTKSD